MKTRLVTSLFWLCIFFSATTANAQYYADEYINSGPCNPATLFCSGVDNPANAVDHVGGTYADMTTIIGVSNSSFIRVGFSHDVPGGSKIGIYLREGSILLNADVLETIEVRVFDDNGTLVGKKTKFKTADLKLLSGTSDQYVISVGTDEGDYNIDEVKIVLNGLVSVLNNIRLNGVAALSDCPSYEATTVFANGPCDPIIPILCPGGVLDAGDAVSADNDDYATLTIPLGIGGSAYIDLAFEPDGNDGDRVSFLIGQNNTLLDADLLGNLSLTVYDQAGNVVKHKDKFNLANLETSILDPNRSTIGVTTKHGDYSIAHARLELSSLVSVLSDLRVYRATTKENTNFDVKVTANGPLTFCDGDNVKLTASGNDENTWQWYKDNEAIAGATGKKYTATSAGGYHVLRTAPAGCGSVSFTLDVVVNCKTGLLSMQQVEVYPNPFSEYFRIELDVPKSINATVTITDISGKVISMHPWTTAEVMQLGYALQTGVYLVQLYDGINFSFNKVIKVD
jgi:hypothetical protein